MDDIGVIEPLQYIDLVHDRIVVFDEAFIDDSAGSAGAGRRGLASNVDDPERGGRRGISSFLSWANGI